MKGTERGLKMKTMNMMNMYREYGLKTMYECYHRPNVKKQNEFQRCFSLAFDYTRKHGEYLLDFGIIHYNRVNFTFAFVGWSNNERRLYKIDSKYGVEYYGLVNE